MTVRERFIQLLEAAGYTQTDFATKAGYSRDALTNFINGRTKLPKVDFFQAVKRAFPTLNLDWLITGQGNMWEGAPPEALKNLTPPDIAATAPELLLLNRLLIQKLEEVARVLKDKDPEAYRALGLGELVGRGR
ncbi:MAG: helix-turn-helix transcriptional regulator [Phaeodactylibacter sp.]|nr:helix-turn-helix transcriptional regulator [Phaeodactylibacter sp.]